MQRGLVWQSPGESRFPIIEVGDRETIEPISPGAFQMTLDAYLVISRFFHPEVVRTILLVRTFLLDKSWSE